MSANYRAEVYCDSAGKYRWRIVSTTNGVAVADSSESYSRRGDCVGILTKILVAGTSIQIVNL